MNPNTKSHTASGFAQRGMWLFATRPRPGIGAGLLSASRKYFVLPNMRADNKTPDLTSDVEAILAFFANHVNDFYCKIIIKRLYVAVLSSERINVFYNVITGNLEYSEIRIFP